MRKLTVTAVLAIALSPLVVGRVSAQPVVSFAGNQFSFEEKCAPGMQIVVFGADLTNGDTCIQTEYPATTELCDARLLLNGEPLGLGFVSPTQMQGVIPLDASLGPGELIAELQDVFSEPFSLVIDPHAPGIQTIDATPTGPGFFHNKGKTVSHGGPADPGDDILGFGTGFGLADPMMGMMLTGGTGRHQEAPVVQLTVGCVTTDVLATAAHPQIPGLDQFAFTVPEGLPGGDQGVRLDINGFKSNRVILPVSGEADVPFICAGVNGASFAPGAPVAAGSILSLFVVNIGDSQRLGLFPATEADGLSVTFNDIAAPLFDVVPSAGQMNVFAPTELPEMGNVEVKLTTATGTSAAFMLEMTQAAPGIFLVQGTSFAAATLANTRWLPIPDATSEGLSLPTNCAENNVNPSSFCGQPIRGGEILTLFVTGLGKATPGGDPSGEPLPTGSVAPSDTLYLTVMTPDVIIGDLPARVLFSGLAPGFAGLYQINVEVPEGVAPGDEVKLKITMPNGTMDMASIAVQP